MSACGFVYIFWVYSITCNCWVKSATRTAECHANSRYAVCVNAPRHTWRANRIKNAPAGIDWWPNFDKSEPVNLHPIRQRTCVSLAINAQYINSLPTTHPHGNPVPSVPSTSDWPVDFPARRRPNIVWAWRRPTLPAARDASDVRTTPGAIC